MSTPEQRMRMAAQIVKFEARYEDGHIALYKLPKEDGGGTYEVAGINDRYNKETVDALVKMIRAKRYSEAEALAADFIAQETDRAMSWTKVPALEFYLRDSVFNRGAKGGARILQRALGIKDDGVVGPKTREAVALAEGDAPGLLAKLRAAREKYERDVVGYRKIFWTGLTNRWNNALDAAKTFPLTRDSAAAAPAALAGTEALSLASLPALAEAVAPATLPALREGMRGDRVGAWQRFLLGQGFDPGPPDEQFGQRTREATKAFQAKHKLASDGVAGRQTLLKAASLGLELIEEPATDNTGSNFPPPPDFAPLTGNEQRAAIFGKFQFVPAPTQDNPEGIKILGTWVKDNIVSVPIPQLQKALGNKAPKAMPFHRLAAKQLQGLWADWEKAKLLDRVLKYDGAFVPRFVRKSHTELSNHSFGSAFDINEPFNTFGGRPALVGEKGCVRELVPIANRWGFFWGGHYQKRKDGMHFEVAFLK